jgi:transcriptional regulator with GAF, ATPase, and Fis domain
MRDNLKKANEEEQQRKWTNEGLAKFVSILRLDNQDLKDLGDKIISNLVKYLNANQGGIFLYNEAKQSLDLLACYAYERKRYIENSIPAGDGLLGQAFLEKDIIYLKEIPNGYVSITSGLGEATPSYLLIIPLKINDYTYGVIEIASFEDFQDYQREFLEKVAENIASTIATAKINERTAQLLRESQEQSEMLRAQEEEMRQNVEELIATQEQMKRKQEEIEFVNNRLKTNEAILKKSVEKTKKQGEELQMVNKVLAQRQEEMQQKLKELENAKAEIEKLKEEEQKRTKLLVEQQKKLMAKIMEDFKHKEKMLKEQLAQKEQEIAALRNKN